MSKSLLPLTALRAFEAAARNLSFTKAAAELNVTQGAVSQQIAFLEKRINVMLFERQTRKLLLTHKGELLAAGLGSAFDQMSAALLAVSQRRADSRELKFMSYPTIATKLFMPRLSRFHGEFPGIELQLTTRIRPADFDKDDVDLAVKEGAGGWVGLRSDRLFSQTLLPVCSPGYLAAHSIRGVDDLKDSILLHSVNRFEDWALWLSSQGYSPKHPGVARELSNSGLAYAAAVEGAGVAMGQLPLVYDELEAGLLVAPLPHIVQQNRHYFVVSPYHRADHPTVVAFRDWLLPEMELFRNRLEEYCRARAGLETV